MIARSGTRSFAAACSLLAAAEIEAFERTETFYFGAIVAASLQCQVLPSRTPGVDACRGGAPVQPELNLSPTPLDTLHLKLGFAAGRGLANVSPFVLSPWVADLQDDVRDINGSGRSYVLTAWWRHRFQPAPALGLAISLGLIDATDYLDDNAYANDEYTQFMSEALVNGPNAFLPSCDPGGAMELDFGRWTLSGVAMRVAEDAEDGHFGFFGGQLAYRLSTVWGPGTYRLLVTGTSEDLLDPNGKAKERRTALMLSFDQSLRQNLGAFVRVGWQSEGVTDGYRAIYSGGIDLDGNAWGRAGDNIGLAYAFLDGNNDNVRQTQVAELYYRWFLHDSLALTFDLQYIRDVPVGESVIEGLIVGTRFVVDF